MAVTDFVEEIRSVGERLLLKLKELPQAEPVELVAFSIIILFTGKWGICPWTLWLCPPLSPRLFPIPGRPAMVPAGGLASLLQRSRKSSVPEEAQAFAISSDTA